MEEQLSCSYSVDEGLGPSIKNGEKMQNKKKLPLLKVAIVYNSKQCLTASGKVPGEPSEES